MPGTGASKGGNGGTGSLTLGSAAAADMVGTRLTVMVAVVNVRKVGAVHSLQPPALFNPPETGREG